MIIRAVILTIIAVYLVTMVSALLFASAIMLRIAFS